MSPSVRTARLLLLLVAFALGSSGLLLATRSPHFHRGLSLLRASAWCILGAIVLSLLFRPRRRRRPFDPWAGRRTGGD